MVRIAPVRLEFNPKTLWFDSAGFDLHVGQAVVVSTARGDEYGHVSDSLFEMDFEDTKKLKSPLKPVKRIATDEDAEKASEAAELSREALPIFKRMASESVPDMNPVAVEYLFEGDKAVFYFESEERVDFRDLVRRLASEFRVRIDMKQIGVRDGARMVGGLGHCGQELCCRRLGGEFNPVTIRMAKEQDLSLNPQKISGLCGRLMCCLRYEFDAYKDFHTRAPKKNARIQTPDGEGKVVDLDVPREVVSIKVGDEKPVKVPLADMEPPEEGTRPNAVGEEAWEKANAPATVSLDSGIRLFTTELTGEDKLAEPGKVRHVKPEEDEAKSTRTRRRRRGAAKSGGGSDKREAAATESTQRKPRRRRSTTVKSDGSVQTETAQQYDDNARAKKQEGAQEKKPSSSRKRRSRSSSAKATPRDKQAAQQKTAQDKPQRSQVGRNSSALRAGRAEGAEKRQSAPQKRAGDADGGASGQGQSNTGHRRRRSRRKPSSGEGASGQA